MLSFAGMHDVPDGIAGFALDVVFAQAVKTVLLWIKALTVNGHMAVARLVRPNRVAVG